MSVLLKDSEQKRGSLGSMSGLENKPDTSRRVVSSSTLTLSIEQRRTMVVVAYSCVCCLFCDFCGALTPPHPAVGHVLHVLHALPGCGSATNYRLLPKDSAIIMCFVTLATFTVILPLVFNQVSMALTGYLPYVAFPYDLQCFPFTHCAVPRLCPLNGL